MQDDTRADTIRAYLVGLYGEDPQGLLWIGGHEDGWRGRTFSDIDLAVTYAIELDDRGGIGVYHRSTTLAGVPEPKIINGKRTAPRGSVSDSRAVHFFALDIDLAGPGHKATNLPQTFLDAVELVEAAGFPRPTCWIDSGGGFYPQWRLSDPIDVRETEMREWVEEAFAGISAHFIAVAGQKGWHLDNVRDLARVFRLPGTTNRKVPAAPVQASMSSSGYDGGSYDLGVLASLARPDRGTVHEAERPRESALTAASDADEQDDLFTEDARRFTREQGKAFIREAMAKLGQTEAGFNSAINAFAMVCAHFPWLADRERCAKLMIKTVGEKNGWDAPDRDDIATINSAYAATEAGKSWVAVEVEESASEENTGGTLSPPGQPVQVARELVKRMPASDGVPHWSWWRSDFYRWAGAHWEITEEPVIGKWLYRQTADATYLVPKKTKEGEKAEFDATPWAPTRKKIGDLAHALGVSELQRDGDEDKVIATANGVVDLATRSLKPHTPALFNLFSLPFDYDPEATAPAWQEFLESVLPDDRQAQDFLGEWFGYVLSGRTDQHKIAALIGKKRSGKGTIARVLGALVGKSNVAGLNLGTLSGTFGLEPFVGAALAVASDVRWKSRTIGDAVQILLEISGEDSQTVARKNKTAWKGSLGVRFMLMSNDTPTFSDRSGALVDRMIYVSFRQSFYGREDIGLTDKLTSELPGIFNWALDGLARLHGRGRFTQPESGLHEQEATRRLADPVGAFLEDWCTLSDDAEIGLDHLYLKFRNWCESEGRDRDSTTKEIFSRDLRNKAEAVTSRRTRENGKFVTVLTGIECSAL